MSERRFDSIPTAWEDFLERQVIPVRLACNTSSGYPLVLSLWYLYRNGRLFCATQNNSALAGHLEDNTRVAFEVAPEDPPYRGIRGSADCRLDSTIGASLLEELLQRYVGLDSSLAEKLLKQKETEVALVLRPRRIFVWDYTKRMTE